VAPSDCGTVAQAFRDREGTGLMVCTPVKIGDTVAIVCTPHQRARRCGCGGRAELLCDWKVSDRKSGTCDRPICHRCAKEVAADKHLCPDHQSAYRAWLDRRGRVAP